jgi:hypothetical protein
MMFVDKEYYITFRESKGIYQPIRKSLKQKLNSYINRTKYYSKFQIRHLHQDVYDLFDLLKINWPNSIFNNNNIFNFYLYLMDRHNITNSSIAAFMFNGESIVLNWLFESENQVIAQLVVRKKDVSISRFSPGALCYFYLINETKNKGINTFSFGRGNEEYKQKWTNKYNQIYRYIIVNNNIVNNNKYFTSYVKLLNS